jgi:hypothetical protein
MLSITMSLFQFTVIGDGGNGNGRGGVCKLNRLVVSVHCFHPCMVYMSYITELFYHLWTKSTDFHEDARPLP